MKKKYINSFMLSLVMLVPLFLSSVLCSWTFYNKPVSSITEYISIVLGKFNFFLPEYPNEYPNNEEGQTNKNIFDTIIGNDVNKNNNDFEIPKSNDGISLSDPNSPINKALGYINIDKKRPYITCYDYFDSNSDGTINNKDKTLKEYFYGNNVNDTNTFIIVRETFNNPFVQNYSIYTCSIDISNLNIGEDIKYVYKTKLKWTIDVNNITSGDYSISTEGNTKGICKVNEIKCVNNKGNLKNKLKLFDYTSFNI